MEWQPSSPVSDDRAAVEKGVMQDQERRRKSILLDGPKSFLIEHHSCDIKDENYLMVAAACPEEHYNKENTSDSVEEVPYFCKSQYNSSVLGDLGTSAENVEVNVKSPESGNEYPCNVCDEIFVNRNQRFKHGCPFSFQTPHVCRCGLRYTTKSDLKEHTKVHTDAGSYACICCSVVYNYPGQLNFHFRFVHICLRQVTCTTCGQGFYKNGDLERHQARHEVAQGHKCLSCKNEFVTVFELQKHSEFHTGKRPYMCLQCGEVFASASELQAHDYRDEIPYRCAVCGKESFNVDGPHKHSHKELKCLMCGYRFSHASKLEKHKTTCYKRFFPKRSKQTDLPTEKNQKSQNGPTTASKVLGESSPEGKLFVCTICDKTFKQAYDLKRHKDTHRNENFKCRDCGEEFSYNEPFRYHCRLYKCRICQRESNCRSKKLKHKAEIIQYSCTVCKKPFCRKRDFEKHRNSLSCSVCRKLFCSHSKLREHERHHTEIWPMSCFLCGRGYDKINSLNRHAKWHHTRGEYACTLCKKLYTSEQELKGHACSYVLDRSEKCFLCGYIRRYETMRSHMHKTHTCRRKVKCHLCGQGFITEHQLNVHTKQHATSHSSKCFLCDKEFCSSEELGKHMDVHAGHAPHACPVCREGFSSWSDLQNHNYTETDKMPHQCTECGQRFWRFMHLTKHSITHKRYIEHSCSLCHVKFMRWFVPNLKRSPTVDIFCNQCREFVKKKSFEVVKPGSPDCELCVKGFTKPNDLSTHLLSLKHLV